MEGLEQMGVWQPSQPSPSWASLCFLPVTFSITGPLRTLALLPAEGLLFWARDKKAKEFPKQGSLVRDLVSFGYLVMIL